MYHIEKQDNITYIKKFPDEFFKLIVTSPPYNLGKSYEKFKTIDDYVMMQEQVINECVRVLHDNGSICWNVGNMVFKGEVIPIDILLYPIFKKLGLKLRNRIIWHFEHGLHCTKRLSGRYETILWFTKSDDYTFNLDNIRIPQKYPNKKHFKGTKVGQLSCNPLGKNPGDVWKITNVKHNHPEKTSHPCQFPLELINKLILSLTNSNDNVLDPYLGSGTTIISSLLNNRHGYGCDIIEEYISIAKNRINKEVKC